MTEIRTGSQRVRRRRDKLRSAGLRPVQIWVPDARAPSFARECGRRADLIRIAEAEGDAVHDDWLEVTDIGGWTA